MKLSLIGAAIALGIIAGCGKNETYKPVAPKTAPVASVKAGEETTLLPLTVGNKWLYTITTTTVLGKNAKPSQVSMDIAMEVKAVDKRADGSVAGTIEISKGDVLQDSQVWIVSPSGIYQESIGLAPNTKTFVPPQPLASFPLELNKDSAWEGKGPAGVSENGANLVLAIKQTLTYLGVEDADTFMGMISSFHFESTQTYSHQAIVDAKTGARTLINFTDKSDTWWAPKVGMVRYVKVLKTDKGASQLQMIMLQRYTVN